MTRLNNEPTTDPPPPPITECFLEARASFEKAYGAISPSDAEYRVNDKAYNMLLRSIDVPPFSVTGTEDDVLTLYGIRVVVDHSFDVYTNVLIASNNISGKNSYNFHIPTERQKVKPPRPLQKPGNVSIPPRPDPRITPTTMRGNYPAKQERLVEQYLHKSDRRFVLWGFVKHKWQSLDETDREGYTLTGVMLWFFLWMLSGIFIFVIPWIILSLIGGAVITITVKHLVKGAWNKYFPEYQEFKQESKSKRKTREEQILYGSVPEWFELEIRSRPREQRESFYHPPPEVAHTPYEWIDGEDSGRKYGAWRPVEQMTELAELFDGYEEGPIKPKPETSYGTVKRF